MTNDLKRAALEQACDQWVADNASACIGLQWAEWPWSDTYPEGASCEDIRDAIARATLRDHLTVGDVNQLATKEMVADVYRRSTPPIEESHEREQTSEIHIQHEGMGGLTAALLIIAGAFIGAVICLVTYYAKTGQLTP